MLNFFLHNHAFFWCQNKYSISVKNKRTERDIILYSIDATAESPWLGRLINHGYPANLKPQVFDFSGPRLGLVATRFIHPGDELVYDYGERNPKVLKELPWLRIKKGKQKWQLF